MTGSTPRSRTDSLTGAFLLSALVLAGIHLYLGLAAAFVPDERTAQFVLIGLAFLAGPIVYLTPYQRLILYLLGVGFAIYLGALWLVSGMQFLPLGLLTGVVATVFTVLAISLFLRDLSKAEP